MKHLLPTIIMVCLFTIGIFGSCNSATKTKGVSKLIENVDIKYAQGFDIERHDNYTKIIIKNPWQANGVQQILYLIKNEETQTPDDGLRLVVPIVNLATGSTTHFGFLSKLNELEAVKGTCSANLIYNSSIRRRVEAGEIVNLGDAFSVDLENIMVLKPQVFLITSYNNQDEEADRLKKVGVNLVFVNEWTEQSPLGRAEWLKLIGCLFDKESLADSLFLETEKNYIRVKQIALKSKNNPKLLFNSSFKGTWYMPSGENYMANLALDAGGKYFYQDKSGKASLSLSFETVLHQFSDADVWLNVPVNTIKELYALDNRHNLFKAAQKGNVFSFMGRYTSSGANDFWESATVEPDVLLKDFIFALQPELLPNYNTVYIKKLE